MSTGSEQRSVTLQPVVKEVSVPLAVERAFALFSDGIGEWWPLASHSVAGENAAACHLEPRLGGRLLETARDGTEHVWGTVLAWEPPHRLELSWHPGRSPDTAQDIEVTFSPLGDRTLVRLVHSGWERLGDAGPGERANYEPGWDVVLGRFIEQAGSA